MTETAHPGEELQAAALDVWLDFRCRSVPFDEAGFARLCARRPDLQSELRRLWADERGHERLEATAPSLASRLEGLRASPAGSTRFRKLSIIGRGGMGVVYRAWDLELDRPLAMKVFPPPGQGSGIPPRWQVETLTRFLEEARVTGQLDHPGIVPVHEAGIDEAGQPFFTMKLVEGRDLRRIIALARTEDEGWNRTRVVGVLLKVCEAMAYAHSKGVIHRDLKPSNVMVGLYGEVFVMDWGVARVVGREAGVIPGITSLRAIHGADSLRTLPGAVLGTPPYMAPEQATLFQASERSDVYAVGAMLHHLLAGRPPYLDPDESADGATLLERLIAGPPASLHTLAPEAPSELRAISARAMARDNAQRYAGMPDLADDLRAYLEGRVVRAQARRPLAAFGKWIARNRGLSATLAGTIVLALVAGLALVSWRSSRANLSLLARLRLPAALRVAYEELWPATPERFEAMKRWLEQAEALASQSEACRRQLEDLRARALPHDPDSPLERRARRPDELSLVRAKRLAAKYGAERERLLREGGTTWEGDTLDDVSASIEKFRALSIQIPTRFHPRLTWSFRIASDQVLHDRLAQVLPEMDELLSGGEASLVDRVRRGATFAGEVVRRSLEDPAEAWRRAIESIRDEHECPRYRGLELAPQLGLVPIGRDPVSGLWEFAHLQSGEPARRGSDGRLILSEETGLVLVLIPGGPFRIGAQARSPDEPNYDPFAQLDEAPMIPLQIEAFFLSKCEMTQSQWARWLGSNPSYADAVTGTLSMMHPVEHATWKACMQAAKELGLTLPSEAQWEYACRAGTMTPWSCGEHPPTLVGCANLLDEPGGAADGWVTQAPVGSFRANPFGLHDVHGNVAEWCRDSGFHEYSTNYYFGSGERQEHDLGSHTLRGGSFRSSAFHARSAARREVGERYHDPDAGLRPAREVER